MNESNKKTGRIYGRFSSKPQEKGTSRERQISETKKWAESMSIKIIGEPYFDEAVSGKNGDNLSKEFGRIIRDSKPGEYIIVEELDRIGRQSPIALLKIIEDIVNKGIIVAITRTGLVFDKKNFNTSAVLITSFSLATVGFAENTRKIERLGDTNKISIADAIKGNQSGTLVKYLPKCFKWDEKSKKITINNEKAEIVRKIFKMYNDGLGVTSICHELNKTKTPTFNKNKKDNKSNVKPWMETSVRKILKNRSYSGHLELNGSIITCIPIIIEPDVFQLTQYLIGKNKGRRGKNSGRTNNLFRYVGICKSCNGTVNVNISPQSKGRKNNLYGYRCKNARLKLCQQPHKMLNANIVEPLFFENYFNGNPESFFMDDENKLEKSKDILIQQIQKNNESINNLIELAMDGNKNVKERILKKEEENKNLEKELSLVNEQIINRPQSISIFQNISSELDPFEKSDNNNILITDEEKKRIKEFINNYHSRMVEKLTDYELRKKISYTMGSLFSSIIFDFENETIQGIKKNGECLPEIKISKKDKIFQKIKSKNNRQ